MRKRQNGQALLLVVLASGMVLCGALGIAVDISVLYGHTQMAQAAADGAAIAGMVSIHNSTNTLGVNASPNTFGVSGGSEVTCSGTYPQTPCAFAKKNGFSTSSDTVLVDWGNASTTTSSTNAPVPTGVGLSSDSVSWLKVSITRNVSASFIRFVGAAATTRIKATAIAATISEQVPVPILIRHPTLSGALTINGSGHGSSIDGKNIVICGGPSQSVQVNSSSATAYGGLPIGLERGGPGSTTDSTCVNSAGTALAHGAGSTFGVFGGPSTDPGQNLYGSTGKYVQPSTPISDPYQAVCDVGSTDATNCNTANGGPITPGSPGSSASISKGTDGCTNNGGCTEYSPGTFNKLDFTGQTVIFKPGIYYVNGGGVKFKQTTGGAVNNNSMCTTCAADTRTGSGILIYDTGTFSSGFASTGGFNFDTGNQIGLQGPTLTQTITCPTGATFCSGTYTAPAPPYYDILLWEDRQAVAHNGNGQTTSGGEHNMGQGNGCFSLTGTIYITNLLSIMLNSSSHYQEINWGGTPCSNTFNQGMLITDQLTMNGTGVIQMVISAAPYLYITKVALVQ